MTELEPNEFLAFCVPYGITTLGDKSIEGFAVGAFAECNKKQVLIFDNHQSAVGVGMMLDSPHGLFMRGRISTFLNSGAAIMKRLHKDMEAYEFCAYSKYAPEDTETKILEDGRQLTVIKKAHPREISFTNSGCSLLSRLHPAGEPRTRKPALQSAAS